MTELKKIREETLPDGRTVVYFENGGKITVPPVTDEWREQKGKELYRMIYNMKR
ncbi:MAG: hypothetical protein FWG36_01945 [Oscillospiraceae bacterium]|nr:hypothetical protein [Oscillospiraceae bacterium]